MDQDGARAALQHYFDRSAAGDEDGAHDVYQQDAVLEFPQSGELFEGVPNFKEWRRRYPAEVDLVIRRVRGGGDVFTAEVAVRYDGGPWNYGVSILEFRDDKIARETIYYAEPFEAPDWRARWRAAPPRPADAD
jgi:ketosteroid isomerase-like protein